MLKCSGHVVLQAFLFPLRLCRRTARPVPLLPVKEPIKHEKQCKVPPLNGQNHLIPEDVSLKCESFSKQSEDRSLTLLYCSGCSPAVAACSHVSSLIPGRCHNETAFFTFASPKRNKNASSQTRTRESLL